MKTLTYEVATKYINDITPNDIAEIEKYLTPTESYRLRVYESKMGENLTPKRVFLFICNLIDFSLTNNNKPKKSRK